MYREEPDNEHDSGWRFMSGFESDDYMGDASKHGIYDVNTIANYDSSIIPFLEAPPGSAFERTSEDAPFTRIEDWQSTE